MQTRTQEWYGNEVVQQNIFSWITNRKICWEIPHNIYTEWAYRNPVIIKNWLRVPEDHSIHASPTSERGFRYYDYVLDIDAPKFRIAQKIQQAILDVFTEFGVAPTLLTFTSNRGFHNWFFQEMFYPYGFDWGKYTVTTWELFYKVSTHYLRDLVAERVGMERKPFQKWIEVKIAKSMVRVPYCMHLGTRAVEIPIQSNDVLNVQKEDAKIENIKEVQLLNISVEDEAAEKWVDVVADYYNTHKEAMDKLYRKPDFVKIEGLGIYAKEDIFPPCVFSQPKEGSRRKVAGFIANFLYYCNWEEVKIQEYMEKWFKTLEESGITTDGHKFYWHQVQKIINHLNKERLFLPGCGWLLNNGMCRENTICRTMKRKHPRFYILEKQKDDSGVLIDYTPMNSFLDDLAGKDERKVLQWLDDSV